MTNKTAFGILTVCVLSVFGSTFDDISTCISSFKQSAPLTAGQDHRVVAHDDDDLPTTVAEARSRAKILHETIHGTLQIMHRDFFRKDESLKIPSRSLEDVFGDLEEGYQVNVRWLAVETKAMSIGHEARNEVEKEAVEHLKKRTGDFEVVSDSHFVFARQVRLSAVCLSCHLPGRSNNDDRFAGLMISMPIREPDNHNNK